ncbi:hypothetical protein ACWC4C_05305 [Streptomyces olivaceoviridis]
MNVPSRVRTRPRVAEELGITPEELAGAHRRFEVVPGADAQVDWGDEGKILAHVGVEKVYLLPHDAIVLPRPGSFVWIGRSSVRVCR